MILPAVTIKRDGKQELGPEIDWTMERFFLGQEVICDDCRKLPGRKLAPCEM
jgi:hypothetical protein